IAFKDGATTLGTGTVQPNKKASITPALFSAGSHDITATYSGDSNFFASPVSSVFTQSVNLGSTSTTLSVSRTTLFFRQKIDLSANVVSGTGAALAGTITFTENGNVLGVVAPDGAGNASVTVIILGTIGNHTIRAEYDQDPNQSGSNSDDSGTTANVQQSPRPATPNQP